MIDDDVMTCSRHRHRAPDWVLMSRNLSEQWAPPTTTTGDWGESHTGSVYRRDKLQINAHTARRFAPPSCWHHIASGSNCKVSGLVWLMQNPMKVSKNRRQQKCRWIINNHNMVLYEISTWRTKLRWSKTGFNPHTTKSCSETYHMDKRTWAE